MHLPLTSDLSVYQLALDNLAPSQPLRVSPTTLTSLVTAQMDVLIEETIPATLWVKQPPFQDWQTALKQYQQVSVPQTIYWCGSVGDELAQNADRVGQSADANSDFPVFPVQLAAGSQLKREYFLIILCDRFSSLMVAYQPEPAAAVASQNQPLLAVFTLEQRVIQRVLEGIREAIAVGDTTPDELLVRGETALPMVSASNETSLLTRLLLKQVQRTEEILHPPRTSDAQGSCELLSNSSTDVPRLANAGTTLAENAPQLLTLTDFSDTTTTASPPDNTELGNQNEFLQRMAQELRTPLTNMKTALKLIDAAQLKPPQRQRYMDLLNRECDRQNSLISGLLDIVQLNSEPQPPVMPSVQVADILPGIVSTYQPIAQEKGIQLGYIMPAGLPAVSCLETWLRVIVINLLNNSLKFTSAGGQVNIKVALQSDRLQLEFQDTGIGIPPNEISQIFESFYRGRSTTGENTGAGLGLTLVQQLLLRCGGSISVTSQLGEGSNFKVLLPVASPKSTPSNS